MSYYEPRTGRRRHFDPGPYQILVLSYEKHARSIGYSSSYVSRLGSTARHFCAWLRGSGHGLDSTSDILLQNFADHRCKCYDGRRSGSPICVRNLSLARCFVRYLVNLGVVDDPPGPEAADSTETAAWFEWLDNHRGLSKSTLHIYRTVFRELLPVIGMDTTKYDAAKIRAAVLDYQGSTALEHRTRVLRSWLRYNTMLGKCPASLEGAVPPIRTRRASRLPRGLKAEDVDRLIASCNIATSTGRRDRAILLLLARLGLRAGDIVRLKLTDIDWANGHLKVLGKGRRETLLPLPQEVGDAVLAWLEDGRPAVPDKHVFLCAVPPVRPFSGTTAITTLVSRAITRAGLKDVPSRGSHLLRHSAARRLLEGGASFEIIGALLRHRDRETTGSYAKVDIEALREVAQPWPGESPC